MNRCPFCGAESGPDAHFCLECGREMPARRVSSQKAVLPDDFNVAALDRLRAEKQRLAGQLNAMLDLAADRELSRQEKKQWKILRKEHHQISQDLAERLQDLSERQERDRREGAQRKEDRRKKKTPVDVERRSGLERRKGDRRERPDRRDPFPDIEP